MKEKPHFVHSKALCVIICLAMGIIQSATYSSEYSTFPLLPYRLPRVDLMLSRGDLSRSSRRNPMRLEAGRVLSQKKFQSTNDLTGISIAGEDLYFEVVDERVVLYRRRTPLANAAIDIKNRIVKDSLPFKLTSGAPYAVAFPYFRLEHNLKSGSYRNALVKGNKFGKNFMVVYDDDMDGKFASGADTYACDTTRIFAPLLSYVAGQDLLLDAVQLSKNSDKLYYKPYSGPASSVKLNVVGNKTYMYFAAFQHVTEPFAFVISNTGTTVRVLPGKYRLLYGYVVKGGQALMSILPGSLTFEVGDGAVQLVRMGEPFTAGFEVNQSGKTISLPTGSVNVLGRGGEFYGNITIPAEKDLNFYTLSMDDMTKQKISPQMEYG